ncbi:LysM peptidoglycan-binding domain-containing protein [Candidatus Deferrimicrobium sp.]|uniref:LysM peptidoglycan-binding domain-containing protein n=1 Tax=Candidatus Deferrimicrobium sp. TaxID=3060586 RepID=UPI00271564A2|nr:LysM peptidoglycan-binding domain-containing protein [Candidatus Deferrimicrobium sp.]MDO8738482.1 LysM peptidoglycan-binding domain-containing protein [Candidatus Deferrimicrobium sp.]
MRNAFAVAGCLLLFASIPSFGGTADTLSPAAAGGAAVLPDASKAGKSPGTAPASTAVPPATVAPAAVPAAPAPGVPPGPAPSVPAQNLPSPPSPAAVPSRLPAAPTSSFVAPPSEKAPDRVLSPGEVDLQVTKNIENVPEEGEGMGEDFFATASKEVAKGKGGVFSGITSPIEKFLHYFQTGGRKRFEVYLSRSGKYVGMMQKILVRYGLPEDLVYVALIESGFSPKAYSVAKAAGPWQFISATGRRYGLRIDWWADERRDAEKSTHAAASYLRDLYGMFESWPLATAAYNAGEGKIQRAVTRYKSEDFSELIRHGYLKQETKDYVPKMLAALTIAKDPDKYGFGDVAYETPMDLRTVSVPGGTDLAAVARLLEVPVEAIRDWNPELRRFCTPPNRERYDLRLSVDAARLAEERMEEIRIQAKITFLQHNVRRGETLQALADRYKTTVPVLKELNGLKRDSLGRTSRLVIPVTGLMETEAVPGTEVSPGQLTMAHMRVEEGSRKARIRGGQRPEAGDAVTVRKGDTLARLAKRHGVRVKELASANGLKPTSKLKVGAHLVLPEPVSAAKSRTAQAAVRKASGGTKSSASAGAVRDVRKRTTRYKVHKGDTLDQIARVYGVTVDRLADRNRLKKSQLLRQGLVLVIPLES